MYYAPSVVERDKKKNRFCVQQGITLITVPYWWDEQLSSLATSIHHVRPDIPIPSTWLSSPIPSDMPQKKIPTRTFRNANNFPQSLTKEIKPLIFLMRNTSLGGGWLKSSMVFVYFGMAHR